MTSRRWREANSGLLKARHCSGECWESFQAQATRVPRVIRIDVNCIMPDTLDAWLEVFTLRWINQITCLFGILFVIRFLQPFCRRDTALGRTAQKTPFQTYNVLRSLAWLPSRDVPSHCQMGILAEPFPSNGCLMYLQKPCSQQTWHNMLITPGVRARVMRGNARSVCTPSGQKNSERLAEQRSCSVIASWHGFLPSAGFLHASALKIVKYSS